MAEMSNGEPHISREPAHVERPLQIARYDAERYANAVDQSASSRDQVTASPYLSGPSVLIDVAAAPPLTMALHELATYAAEYGARTMPGGGLTVTRWTDGERVHLLWR